MNICRCFRIYWAVLPVFIFIFILCFIIKRSEKFNMKLMDKIRGFVGMDDDDDDVEFEAEVANEKSRETNRKARRDNYDENKIVNINATTKLKVVLLKPEHFEDASSIADHLNDKKTVVLNLEFTNRDVARRLIDFLGGVAYANNGQLKRVANNIYIITPYNVDLMGDDLIDELENNGIFFK